MVQQSNPISIFCCYAHEDKSQLLNLKKHLIALQKKNEIKVYHDGDISAGEVRDEEIKKYLNNAQIILLLISADFMASKYDVSEEMQHILERHKKKEVKVIPIILKPVDWKVEPFSTLQALPEDGKPINKWTNQDDAWVDIVRGIGNAVNKLRGELTYFEEPVASPLPTNVIIPTALPPSSISNSSIKRRTVLIGLGSVGIGLMGTISEYLITHPKPAQAPINQKHLIFNSTHNASATAHPISHSSPIPKTNSTSQPSPTSNNGATTSQHTSTAKTDPTPTGPIGELLNTYLGHKGFVYAVAWSPNQKNIASGSGDNTTQVWTPTATTASYIYNGSGNHIVYAVAWSPSSNNGYVASANNGATVQVWSALSGTTLVTYTGHMNESTGFTNEVYAVDWSLDGKYLASGGRDTTVQIRTWNASTPDILTYHGHTGQIYAVAWSPSSNIIASAGTDASVRIWDAVSGQDIFNYTHANNVNALSWSPDGRYLASGSTDTSNGHSITVQVWDIIAKQLIYSKVVGTIYALKWSPQNNQHIVVAGANGFMQMWDSKGNIFYNFQGQTQHVLSVAWSPDGTCVASGGADNKVRVWSAD